MILPKISNISSDNVSLQFDIENCSVSLPNSIRRTVLSKIPCVAINTDTDNGLGLVFHDNNTKQTNEMLAQRLSSIPVYIQDVTFPWQDYRFEINVTNTSTESLMVTSRDIQLFSIKNNRKADKAEQLKIFPPDPLTTDFIDIALLRPNTILTIPPASLHITGTLTVSTAGENGSYAVATEATCICTQDKALAKRELKDREKIWLKEGISPSTMQMRKSDFMRLDAFRMIIPRAFTLKIATVGVFSPEVLVSKACDVIISNLASLEGNLMEESSNLTAGKSTIPYSYDYRLTSDSNTIGRLLESVMFDQYYSKDKTLTYCGFSKPHPHSENAILRFSFHIDTNSLAAIQFLRTVINEAKQQIEAITPVFSQG